MENPVQILGPDGRPLPPARRPGMLIGGNGSPYDAADNIGSHMADWNPMILGPDVELNMYRDRIVSRVRDLVRNDGWASGGVTRILDNAIGANFRPVCKPDYRALADMTGNDEFNAEWADQFGRAVEARWRTWANDPGRWCDLHRNLTVAQMMRLAFRHKLVDGDALAILHWKPGNISLGRARYATTVQIVDPDRLSNPQQHTDLRYMRGGVEINEDGAAVAYWIRKAHQGDWFVADKSMTWERVLRETAWCRPIVVHDFDADRASQNRGGAGVLAPVVQRLKMLVKYDSTELDAAIINAVFGAYIESPFDSEFVEQALGGGDELNAYQAGRNEFHGDRRLSLAGARIPTLFPGEKITAISAARPASNFGDFERAVLRNAAAGMGISAQQLSQDWSDVNYSSARASLLEAWKTLTVRRTNFSIGFAQPIFSAFLEEVFEDADLPLPPGAPDFIEARAAYSRCTWMGPGRGWVDPVAEKQGAVLGMDAGLSTLEAEAAENVGEDWEEILDQRQREIAAFKQRGLTPPSWAGMQTAQEVIKKPEAV
ncbi:phage portal protein [Aquitalea magnusonii]|uniref:Lambda family phage portal protein n=1 Tax=Aquitalea magnusonii TaxID=332411 RepID=A0A318JW75_9NEIS|nr:phage portal protein [Aquitalea magnusonii]PXX49382.1 lambda family phage portal protein [Aquitalea magnusonii]